MVKLSVNLSAEDVEVLDRYAAQVGLRSRSAAVQHAVRLVKYPDLEQQYDYAWAEWERSGQADFWLSAEDDGLDDAAR